MTALPTRSTMPAASQPSTCRRGKLPLFRALIRVRSITPFAWAFATISSNFGNWLSSVATSSLPQRLCGTPRSAQYR